LNQSHFGSSFFEKNGTTVSKFNLKRGSRQSTIFEQLIIIIAKFISDWRRCKSVIDEILQLLQLAKPNFGSEIPLPLLAVSSLLDGASATRGFINTIQEMQKKGLPTGNMPDGSPNLMLQALLSQSKGQSKEQAENGKTMVCSGPFTITPAGLTVPKTSYGKSF
jgi:hypothetical protein